MSQKLRPDDTQQVIRDIGKGATSAVRLQGKLLKKLWANTLGAIWIRFWYANWIGKIFVLLGLSGSVAIVYLALNYGVTWEYQEKERIVLTINKANVRESISTKTQILRQASRHEELIRKGEADNWWLVQAEDWDKPGWVSKSLAKLDRSKVVIVEYQARGYIWILLGCLMVMYVGFCLRKKPLPQ
jgi:hypothetical protein